MLVADRAGGGAECQQLGVGGGIALGERAIMGAGDDFAAAHYYGTDRHLTGAGGKLRLGESDVHEIRPTHASSPFPARANKPHELAWTPMSRKPPANEPRDKERIAKVMARAGLCSRRDAEACIVAGRVSVNGERLVSPAFTVSNSDRIEVDGKPLPGRERTRLFLYHKPKGLVTTNRDERGRPTIFGALPKHLPRLMSIGRLDINSEGLLLLTNDGGLARALELPDTGWLRRYRVRAQGRVTQAALDRLSRGITVEGIKYGSIQATLDREQASNVWLTLGLREGKNREVRNVLRELGLSVNRLIRVSYGPFQLGELAPASVEEVKMRVLREQLGGKVERLAGADFSAPLRGQEDEPPQKPTRTAPTPSRLKSDLSDFRSSKTKSGSPDFRSSKTNSGKPEFGKASRSSPSSPPARGRWKSKRNVARGRGPQR